MKLNFDRKVFSPDGGAGGGAPAPAEGGAPAPAPAAEGGAPAPAPAAEGGAPAPATAAPSSDWSASLPDNLKGVVANKGWSDPAAVVQSYTELEKFAGSKANFVEVPDPTDAEAVKSVMSRMGVPEDVAGYNIQFDEGVNVNEDFLNSFKQAAHANNILPESAQQMAEWYQDQVNQSAQAAEATKIEAAEQAIGQLRQDWGREFDSRVAEGQNAVRALGLDAQFMNQIEGATSTPAVMELMAIIGRSLGEGDFKGAEGGGNAGFTTHQASARINELMGDKAFRSRYTDPTNPGHKSAIAEMDKLQIIAAGQ